MAITTETLTVTNGDAFTNSVSLSGRVIIGMITDSFTGLFTLGVESDLPGYWAACRTPKLGDYSLMAPAKMAFAAQGNHYYVLDGLWAKLPDTIRLSFDGPVQGANKTVKLVLKS